MTYNEAKLCGGSVGARRAAAASFSTITVGELGWTRGLLLALLIALVCAGALGGAVYAAVQSADVRAMDAGITGASGQTVRASVIQYEGRYLLPGDALQQLGIAAPGEAFYYGSEAYYPLEDVPSLRLMQ